MTSNAVRISFVDDHPTLLRGLVSLFAADPQFEVKSTGATADEVRRIGLDGSTDVLVTDLSMPGDVFEAVRSVTENGGHTQVVIFTAYADSKVAVRALDCGATAYVLKAASPDDLYEAIETVRRGEVYVSPSFSSQGIAGFQKRGADQKSRLVRLSKREEQLIGLLQQGKTNKEIALTLKLTEKTVKHYMTNLMAKMRVKSRLEVLIESKRWLPILPNTGWPQQMDQRDGQDEVSSIPEDNEDPLSA